MRKYTDTVMAMHRRNVANCVFSQTIELMSKRIAIVEDEAAIRENYAAAFRREGYKVDMYDSRKPAMDASSARPTTALERRFASVATTSGSS